jgi:membrane protease YdiL (CAAX protease family)
MKEPKAARLDGKFERDGRNPVIGALLLVFMLGALYFLLGNLVELTAIFAKGLLAGPGGEPGGSFSLFGPGAMDGNFLDNLEDFYRDNRVLVLGVTVFFQFAVFLGCGLALTRKWLSSTTGPYLRYNRVRGLVWGLLAAFLILPVVDCVSWVTYRFFPLYSQVAAAEGALYRWDSPLEAFLIVFAVSITPAICEEALFRGVLQRTLARKLAFPWSFVVSGVIFAFYHQSALSLPALIPVGMLLGFLYWSFDSIWPGMICHATYNGMILLFANYPQALPRILSAGDYFRPWVWGAGAIALAAFCLAVGARALSRKGRWAEEGIASDFLQG